MTIARSVARSVASSVASSVAVSGGGGGGSSYDADALAYFTAVGGAGGSFDLSGINATYTESYVKTAHSTLFETLKADGVWSKVTELYLLVGKTFDGITVKAKGTGALTNNGPFVSGDYVAAGSGAGLTDGASKYIDTGFDMTSTFNITDGATIGLYLQSNDSTTNGRLMGRYVITSNELRLVTTSSEGITAYPGSAISSSGIGFFAFCAKNGAQELFKNGTSVVSNTVTGLTMPSGNMHLLGINGLTGDTTCKQSLAFISEYLTDTDVANLTTAVETFMDALGAGVIA